MPKLLCYGYGYSARALARRLRPLGWHVAGTTRSLDKVQALAEQGVEAHAVGPGMPLSAAAWRSVTHLLISAAPDASGDPLLDHLAEAPPDWLKDLQWIGYLSTTGVYGDHQGAWVTEDTPPNPQSDRARRRLLAERGWAAWGLAQGCPVHIFRLAGIYGPGRSTLDSLRDGTARRIIKPGQVFSRIHVDDIANVVHAAIDAWPHSGLFNVCDDEPAAPAEVVACAARLLGRDLPPEEDFATALPTMSEMARSFYADNKRVSNARIKDQLGVRLLYPTYREGLAAILVQEVKSNVMAD